MSSYGVIILAGGKSERMQFPKPYLFYNGKTFLECIIEGYANAGLTRITIVLNEDLCKHKWEGWRKLNELDVKIIKNSNPELGRMNSILLAVNSLDTVDFCFIQNVDNPFLDSDTIVGLIENKNELGYTYPVYKKKGGHPILISQRMIEYLKKMEVQEVEWRKVMSQFSAKKWNTNNPAVTVNINTPQEYSKFIKKECFEEYIF